jgi:hypothetical protein
VFGAGIGAVSGGVAAAAVPEHALAVSITGQLSGEAAKYLLGVAARINEDWKPVVFGRWARSHIEKLP